MKLKAISKKKLNLSNEYFLFSVIGLMSICFISAGFCYYYYCLYRNSKENSLLKLTKIISFELRDMLDENKNILKFFGSKIADQINPRDFNSISNLLMASGDLDIKSMTKSYICWANIDGKLVVSGKHGILQKNNQDIRDRIYFVSAKKNPWTLQIARPAKSFFSGSNILPTAMGIQNKDEKFIGYLILGLRIDHINRYIEKIGSAQKASYIVLDENFSPVLSSESVQHIEELINKEQLSMQFSTKQEILTVPIHFNNIKYSYLVKMQDYPFFILVGYDINIYRQDFLNKVGARLVEFLFVGIFCLVLLYFFRKKIISPVTNLSDLAFLIAKGNLNVKIPKQSSIEMFNLAKGLLLVIKYIRKTELYKQKLELADQISKDSDYARAEFIKKMHYEFSAYFKEIFVYSELINKHFKNNSIVNEQMIRCAKKIQELVMIINSKTSNILELSYFDLNIILKKAIQINLKNSFFKEINIFTDFQSGMPNIYADKLRIKQILISLIRQSIENSHKNSEIFLTSSIHLEDNCSWFKITIIDQSFGLDEHDLNTIEEKFNGSMDNAMFEFTKMKIEFIEKLVSMHNGKLQITNKLQEGRNVQVLLPLLLQEGYANQKNVIYIADKIGSI